MWDKTEVLGLFRALGNQRCDRFRSVSGMTDLRFFPWQKGVVRSSVI